MDHRLIQALLEGIAPVVKAEIGALRDRIVALEAMRAIAGEDGADGAPGRDGIDGKDGAPGIDGKDGAPGADGARGEDGIGGLNGAPGRDGVDGKDAVLDTLMIADAIREMKEFENLVAGLIVEHLENSPPLRGPQGPQGEPGIAVSGKDGAPGKDGENGRDGRDGQPGVPGQPGAKGADGQDGLGIDDYEVVLEDEGRHEVRRWKRGEEVVREIRIRRSDIIYRGIWKPEGYMGGDAVTYDGSIFIAKRDTSDKPGTSDAWQLSVKRGRDGKDGDRSPLAAGPVKLR